MPRWLTPVFAGLFALAAARADDKGTVTEIDGLKSTTPAAWKAKEVTAPNRVYHFILPKAKDDKYDAECIVFFFGAGGGGGVKPNVTRWKGMIAPPEGKNIDDVSKVEELKIGNVKATVLDAQGTYTHKMRPFDPTEVGEKRADYRLIGVVFESQNGPYYIRLVGPAKTIEAHKKGFDEWLKSLK
jgi:hypothetical protein